MKRLVAAFLAPLAFAASAIEVVPTRYDMPNGASGAYYYWDNKYNGAGCKVCDGAFLSNGVGDLTDGIVATANWNIAETSAGSGPYVGWLDINPTITFFFAPNTTVSEVTFHFDDSQFGGVTAPLSVTIGGQNYAVINPPGIDPFAFTVAGLSLVNSPLSITINRNGRFTFASEIDFFATAVPETSTAMMMIMGLGLAGVPAFRRRLRAR